MQTKIIIRTPKGHAKKMEKRLRPYLLGKNSPHSIFVNDDDNELVWEVEAEYKRILKINRNVSLFDSILKGAFNSKAVKKAVQKKLSLEDQAQLNDMLFNHTTVEIIKEATAQEIVDANKSWWQNVKEKWKKI